MNREAPYRKRAEQTRKKIDKNDRLTSSQDLPPRNRVHGKKQKNKWHIKYPIIRLLLLFFVLLPITIYGAYSLINQSFDGFNRSVKSSGGYERIRIEENPHITDDHYLNQPELNKDQQIETIESVEPASLSESDMNGSENRK